MKKNIFTILLCITLFLTFFCSAGCNEELPSASDGRLKIVCSGFTAYDLCREIKGDGENITLLGKAGIDMHSFEPTAADILAVADADVFVYVGGASDSWVNGVLNSADNKDLVTVSMMSVSNLLSEAPVADTTHHHEHGDECDDHSSCDEHVWMSLTNAKKIVGAIADALCRADEENSADYRQRSLQYTAKLDTLRAKYADLVASSVRKTILVADRFPFLYLTDELGLEYYAAFPGCSSETHASFATQTFLIEKVRELSLPCIFVTDSTENDMADKISADTGAKILRLYSAQTVSATELDKISYLSIVEKNYESLMEALN